MLRKVLARLSLWLVMFALFGTARAQNPEVPIATQYVLFLKIFAYDHALADGPGEDITIGVLYQPRYRASRSAEEEFRRIYRDTRPPSSIKNRRVRVVGLELGEGGDIRELLEANDVDLLYVTPLRSFEVRDIRRASRSLGIVTFTGVPEYVEQGLAVGLDLMGGKPKILINAAAATAEGATFSGQLLQLARIVKS